MASRWATSFLAMTALLMTIVQVVEPKDYKNMTEEELYEYIFDDVDVDYIILNGRICDIFLKCFYNTGKCSSLAAAIKSRISEVFSTVCGKCTEKQKKIWRHILHIFIPLRPKDWEKILEIYDPDGTSYPGIKNFMDTYPVPEWPLKE